MDEVVRAVREWEGVTERALPDGAVELLYAGRPLGTVAPDGSVELRFQAGLAAMLVETGRAEPRGPGRVGLAGDPAGAVELFRLAHERARVAERVRAARG